MLVALYYIRLAKKMNYCQFPFGKIFFVSLYFITPIVLLTSECCPWIECKKRAEMMSLFDLWRRFLQHINPYATEEIVKLNSPM